MSVAGNEGGNGNDRGLRPVEPQSDAERALGVPFAAMAEALRLNAEALGRLDRNQQKIAETIERNDKAGQVVTSTRALNETFRGLTEIQRGLLDSLVQGRGRGQGLPFAFAAIAVLAAMLGFLAYERLSSDSTIPREVYEASRKTSDDRADRLVEMRATVRDSGGTLAVVRGQLADAEGRAEAAVLEKEAAERKVGHLEQELASKASRLKNFLAVKDIADRVGVVEVRNAQLEGENRRLLNRIRMVEKERDGLLVAIGERNLEERGRDPEAVKQAAKDRGLLREEPDADARKFGLTPSQRRRVRRQLNNLLQQAPGEEAYEVIAFGGLKQGKILTDVKLGHYRSARLLNSLHCKSMEIVVDLAKDTVEIRLAGGFFASNGKKIPFAEGGHSIFLKDLGIQAWRERALVPVEVGGDGRLGWKP